MSERNLTHEQEMVVESHAPYLKVWAGLLLFTVIEYVYAHLFKDAFAVLVFGLMFWACIKAAMVGWYFMHLKFEGRWVYGVLVPVSILATVLVVGLVPDIALQPFHDEGTAIDEFPAVVPSDTPARQAPEPFRS